MHNPTPEPSVIDQIQAVSAAWDKVLDCHQAAEQTQKLNSERDAARATHVQLLPPHASARRWVPPGAVTSALAPPDPGRQYQSLRDR